MYVYAVTTWTGITAMMLIGGESATMYEACGHALLTLTLTLTLTVKHEDFF